jgi:hypothetical protein
MTSAPWTVPRDRQMFPETVDLTKWDATVGEQGIHTAGVIAPRRDRGES